MCIKPPEPMPSSECHTHGLSPFQSAYRKFCENLLQQIAIDGEVFLNPGDVTWQQLGGPSFVDPVKLVPVPSGQYAVILGKALMAPQALRLGGVVYYKMTPKPQSG